MKSRIGFLNLIIFTCLAAGCLFIISCSDEDSMMDPENIEDPVVCVEGEPTIPPLSTIDLDGDGSMDFEIDYSLYDIESATAGNAYVGYISPIGQNEILSKRFEPTLFPLEKEDIKTEVVDPLEWENRSQSSLVSIDLKFTGMWAQEWVIWTIEERPTHLVGLKLKNNNQDAVGWIEIDISKETGIVTILDLGML